MRRPSFPSALFCAAALAVLIGCGHGLAQAPRAQTWASSVWEQVPGAKEAQPMPHYRLNLTLDTAGERLVGREQVTIPNRSKVPFGEIVFRLYPNLPRYDSQMGIGPVWVEGERMPTSFRADRTSLVVPLIHPLRPGASITISMTFDVQMPQDAGSYVLAGYSQGIWIAADGYPLLAVHDGTAWYEETAPPHGDPVFADAALYEVNLTLPPTLTLATTGAVIGQAENAAGQRVYQIAGGPLREFTWLASADYRVAETTAYGAKVRSYYLAADEAAGKSALNQAAAALRIYADAFGPYPFGEMAVAEAPLRYYGMEYPGLNLIGLDLYRDKRSEMEARVVHEIAHQWWYAQVGSNQVNTPWLDEGLAEHSTASYYREVYGEGWATTLSNQRWLEPYQTAIDNGYDAVVNQPASAFGGEYEVMVYGKAALFFDSVRDHLGDETYHAALREYTRRFQWRIATPEDLLQVFESVSGQELDGLYQRWILSKQ